MKKLSVFQTYSSQVPGEKWISANSQWLACFGAEIYPPPFQASIGWATIWHAWPQQSQGLGELKMLGFHFIAGILFILGKVQKYMRQLMSSGSNKVACRIIARLHRWRGLEAEPKSKEKEKCFLGCTLDHFILRQEETGRRQRIPSEHTALNSVNWNQVVQISLRFPLLPAQQHAYG